LKNYYAKASVKSVKNHPGNRPKKPTRPLAHGTTACKNESAKDSVEVDVSLFFWARGLHCLKLP